MELAAHTLTISIEPPVLARFPALELVGFTASHLDTVARTLTVDDVRAAWERTAAAFARRGMRSEDIPMLSTVREWRKAFELCGLAASSFTGSVEALLRGVLTGGMVAPTVPISGLCSAIAARHMASIRGWDLDALPQASINVRFSKPATDWFVPLQARPTDVPSFSGAVVCAAGDTVLCWSFNHRESRQTCLSAVSTRALFFSEALNGEQAHASAEGMAELRQHLAERGAAVSEPGVANAEKPRIEFDLRPHAHE
jgi:DNA/RNA-binding domain of Phe-tRNA-synthetase-like protein